MWRTYVETYVETLCEAVLCCDPLCLAMAEGSQNENKAAIKDSLKFSEDNTGEQALQGGSAHTVDGIYFANIYLPFFFDFVCYF